jgi:hypothetical protein
MTRDLLSMNLQEMESQFAGEWVLVDPETDETGQVIAGRVLAQSVDRDTVYDAGFQVKPPATSPLCASRIRKREPRSSFEGQVQWLLLGAVG